MKSERTFPAAIIMLAVISVVPATALATPDADAARGDIQKTLGFVPGFMKLVPDLALPGAWMDMKGLQLNPATALPGKMKELVGLAVSAQIPCEYCIYAHTEFAKLNGATDAEISEAVAMGALTRRWSTFLNGIQTDEGKFRGEISQLVTNMQKSGASGATPPKAITVVDGKTALDDVKQSFGLVPEFLRRYPQEGLAGAWTEMRDLEMNPSTAIPGKYKTLIGLAVAAQIPCKFCIIADTEFAKLEGSSDRELTEAVAMAGMVRHWSTILNGRQADKAAFKKDISHLVAGAKKHMAMQKPEATTAAK
ncbi:MAG TPA: carboxymuconolactone decarboxylase family protein [Polyangia bacterium]|nr:carboxymuconolactone decarboxylase family protein [Polyangia bacterium]